MSEPTEKTLKLHPLDRPLRGDELKAVGEEIKQDEQAAREPDSGGPDTALTRVEREIAEIKARESHLLFYETSIAGMEAVGGMNIGGWPDWNETQRLAILSDRVDWSGIAEHDKRELLGREVDFSRVTPEDRVAILGGEDNRHSPDGHDPGERSIRPLTRQLIDCCRLDVWPGHAAVVDFGLDSDRHLGALQYAIREELVTPQELDAAMGKGASLTEIAQRGDNPYRDATFKTSWDGLMPEPEDPPPARAKSDFDRELDKAARQGKYQQPPDKERDR